MPWPSWPWRKNSRYDHEPWNSLWHRRRPGDPELITLKALKVLQETPTSFAASSSKNTYSVALDIIRSHLNGSRVEQLPFPMTQEEGVLEDAWEKNARRVLEVLATGADAAFITLGDPMTFSTFGYLLKSIQRLNPAVPVVTIPGITSYNAAAALIHMPISEGGESFCRYVRSHGPGPAQGSSLISLTISSSSRPIATRIPFWKPWRSWGFWIGLPASAAAAWTAKPWCRM